ELQPGEGVGVRVLEIGAGPVQGDGQVHQHAIDTPGEEILVRALLIVVRPDPVFRNAAFLQGTLAGAGAEGADHQVLVGDQLVEVVETLLVGPDGQLQPVDVIRSGEAHLLLALGGDLQTIHGEIVIAAGPVQAEDEGVETVLLEVDGPAQFPGQGGNDV